MSEEASLLELGELLGMLVATFVGFTWIMGRLLKSPSPAPPPRPHGRAPVVPIRSSGPAAAPSSHHRRAA